MVGRGVNSQARRTQAVKDAGAALTVHSLGVPAARLLRNVALLVQSSLRSPTLLQK